MEFVPALPGTAEVAAAEELADENLPTGSIPASIMDRVAPEVRIPLASIVGSLELLHNGSLGALLPYQQKILSVATRNVHQLSAMLEDMFTTAQIDEQQFHIFRENCELKDIVEGAFIQTKEMFSDRSISWILNVEPGIGKLEADAPRLQRALMNLIMNAAKFSPDNGKVTVTLKREFGRHVLIIADEGFGIDSHELERVGERFFRSARAREAQVAGVGLGFTVAKKILTLHDGDIFVDSSDLGTLVVVQLPFLVSSEGVGDTP